MAVVKVIEPKCIACEQCIAACPEQALELVNGMVRVIAERCNGCGECVRMCPSEALELPVEAVGAPSPGRPEAATVGAPSSGRPDQAASAKPPEVWAFVEQTDGVAAHVSWELIGKAAEIARDLDGRVAALLLGHNVRPLADEAIAYGADIVYLVDDPVLAHYRTQPYLHAAVSLVRKYEPTIFLLGATAMGRDLAGAVATSLRTGLTADCTGLSINAESKLLEQTRPAYGGNIMATILCANRRPQMSTVRPRVMPMPARDESRQGRVIPEGLGLRESDVATRLLEYHREDSADEVRIEDASVIVSGGRGLGSPEGFKLLEELAQAAGGVVAGSRGAVDSGWISAARQVGQTGKTVRPKVYIACGISGSIQHLVGMQTSDVIIAINVDPEAPIFKVATYGIVGDLYQIVPALAREFRARLSGRPPAEAAAS
jgi:electron transfer flavoprotein alpha subunit